MAKCLDPEDDLAVAVFARLAAEDGTARRLRVRARASQVAVAREVPCTHGSVSHWELGKRLPRGELAVRYGRVLLRLKAAAR